SADADGPLAATPGYQLHWMTLVLSNSASRPTRRHAAPRLAVTPASIREVGPRRPRARGTLPSLDCAALGRDRRDRSAVRSLAKARARAAAGRSSARPDSCSTNAGSARPYSRLEAVASTPGGFDEIGVLRIDLDFLAQPAHLVVYTAIEYIGRAADRK